MLSYTIPIQENSLLHLIDNRGPCRRRCPTYGVRALVWRSKVAGGPTSSILTLRSTPKLTSNVRNGRRYRKAEHGRRADHVASVRVGSPRLRRTRFAMCSTCRRPACVTCKAGPRSSSSSNPVNLLIALKLFRSSRFSWSGSGAVEVFLTHMTMCSGDVLPELHFPGFPNTSNTSFLYM
jgi:hypothetical protein